MTANGMLQVVLYFIVLIAAATPGRYMARVYSGGSCFLELDRRPCGTMDLPMLPHQSGNRKWNWKAYAGDCSFSVWVRFIILYRLQRLQGFLLKSPRI